MARVQVLLSAYKGERYIQEQVESILNQDTQDEVHLLVRDDGSPDRTGEIAEKAARTILSARASLGDTNQGSRSFQLERGQNLGFIQGFFALLQMADATEDAYAFSDQDDVWVADKLSRAMALLQHVPAGVPALVCTRVQMVDEALHPMGLSPVPIKPLGFRHALVENAVTGATLVINRAARQKILEHLPQHAYLHDWWIYLVVSAFGEVFYDATPSILYRQHEANAVGMRNGYLSRQWLRLRRMWRSGGFQAITRQAEEFDALFGSQLDKERANTLRCFLKDRGSLGNRMHYVLTCDVYRQKTIDQLLFRIAVLARKV